MIQNIRPNALFILAVLALSTLASCSKYEDNSWFFHLRDKEKRVVNSWDYELVLRNGLDVTTGSVLDSEDEITIDYSQSSIGFDDDGRFATWIYFNEIDSVSNLIQYDGSWEFANDKEVIILTFDEPVPPTGGMQTWNLSRLQENSLWWIENTDDDNHIEYRLTPNLESGGLFN